MNKVVVLPYEIYSQLQRGEARPTNLQPGHQKLVRLEEELKNALDSNKPDDEKRILYQQILQNYLKAYDDVLKQGSEDESHVLKENSQKDTNEKYVDPLMKIIHNVLPRPYHDKAETLYNSLEAVDGLKWDKSGKIHIDGSDDNNGNITDIVVDLMKKWKRIPPRGWTQLRRKLQRVNFPTSLVYNPARLNELTVPSNIDTPTNQVETGAEYESSITPHTTRKRVRSRPYSVSAGKRNATRWLRF